MSYLGPPLSLHKLTLADLRPTIAKANKYLAGWQASMLSYAECVILINDVLDSLQIYAMSATIRPKNTIEALDKKKGELSFGREMMSAPEQNAWWPRKIFANRSDKGNLE